jgi:hypothetical protein
MVSSSTLAGSNQEWLPLNELTIILASHQNHLQISLIAEDYPMNQREYTYLRWEVTHPITPIVWRNDQWYKLHHSMHTGHPYHTGERIDIYPTLHPPREEDEASKLTDDLINL